MKGEIKMGKKKKMRKVGFDIGRTYADDLYALEKGLANAGRLIFGDSKSKKRKDKTVYEDKRTKKEFRKSAQDDVASAMQAAMNGYDGYEKEDDWDDIYSNDPTLRNVPRVKPKKNNQKPKHVNPKSFVEEIEEENKYASPDEYKDTYYGEEVDEEEDSYGYGDEDGDDENENYYTDATPEKTERVIENSEVYEEEEERKSKSVYANPITLPGMIERDNFGLNISFNSQLGRVVFNDGFSPYTISLDQCHDIVDFNKVDLNQDPPLMVPMLMLYMTACSHPMGILPLDDFLMTFKDVQDYDGEKFTFFMHNDWVYMYYMSSENNYALEEMQEYRKMDTKQILEFFVNAASVAGSMNNMFPGDNEDYIEKFNQIYNMKDAFIQLLMEDYKTKMIPERERKPIINQDELIDRLDVLNAASIFDTANEFIDRILLLDEDEKNGPNVESHIYDGNGEDVDDPSFDLDLATDNTAEEIPREEAVVETHAVEEPVKKESGGIRIGFPKPERPKDEWDFEIPETDPDSVDFDDEVTNDINFTASDEMIARLKDQMSGVRETQEPKSVKEEVMTEVNAVSEKIKSTEWKPASNPEPVKKEESNNSSNGSMTVPVFRR